MNGHAAPAEGLRRLWRDDMPAFRAHLLRLDAGSRFDRFGMTASDGFVIRYAERCGVLDDVIYGWFDAGGEVRAAAELRGVGVGGAAEAAFSVEAPWRRRGIGTALMGRIVRAARDRRADTLYMACLARNVAMQRLARKYEAEMRFEPERRARPRFAAWLGSFGDARAYATAILELRHRACAMRRV